MRPDIGGYHYLLSDIVVDNKRWVPEKVALIYKGRETTWAEFSALMEQYQRALASLGVTRGSRVAILERNSDSYVILCYALAGMGAVMVPINMWLRPAEITYILQVSMPSLMLTSPEFLELAQDAVAPLAVQPQLVLRNREGELPDNILDWSRVIADAPKDIEVSAPYDWDDPHLILFTSGTTGRPKAAVISHRRTVLDTLNAMPAFDIKRFERFYCYMPLFHTGAWDYLKIYFMQRGSAVIAERFDAAQSIREIEDHRCTGMFGVPVVLRKMVEDDSWTDSDMSSMRLITYANYDPNTMIIDVMEAFRARGAQDIRISMAYGLTEGGCYICINRPEDAESRPLSIGVPVPGVQVALLGEDLNEVAPGEMGEICVRSPALMSGYLNQPEATAEIFRGGWLHSGDIGRVDEDGFFYLVDRKKDMIRSGGENIFAKEVELVILSHEAVLEVGVLGIPCADYGERVVAVAVLKPGWELAGSEITAFVRGQIAGFKAPKDVHFWSELPKTPAGKIMKHVIRKQLLDS